MSNRLTFSLASLILIFALVALPAIAHKPNNEHTDGTSHGENHDGRLNTNTAQRDTAEDHTHSPAPTISSLKLYDPVTTGTDITNVGTKSDTEDNTGQVKLTTDAAGGTLAVAADGSGVFVMRVVFDQDVFEEPTGAQNRENDDLISSDLTVVAYQESAPSTNSGDVSVTAVTRVTDTSDTFDIVFSVGGTAFTGLFSTTAPDPVIGHVLVKQDVLYNDITRLTNNELLLPRGNVESSTSMFRVVGAFGDKNDTTAPTVTMTPSAITLATGKSEAKLTIASNDKLGGTLAIGDFAFVNATGILGSVVPNTATDDDPGGETYELTVTVTDTSMDAMVTLKKDSVTDAAGNKAPAADITSTLTVPDSTPPTVEITVESKDANRKHKLNSDGTVDFKLTFSEPLAKSPSISRLQVSDFTIERYQSEAHFYHEFGLGWAGGINLAQVTLSEAKAVGDEEEYTLTVPAGPDPQIVTIDLDPRQVTDTATPNGNILGGTSKSRWAKFDTIAPTVKITPVKHYIDSNGVLLPALSSSGRLQPMLTGSAMSKVMFAFEFDEELAPAFSTDDIDRAGSDNVRLLTDSAPLDLAASIDGYRGARNTYTVVVTPSKPDTATTVLMLRNSVTDIARNSLQADTTGTYTPQGDATPPTVTINVAEPLNCDIGNPISFTIADPISPSPVPTSGLASTEAVTAIDKDPKKVEVQVSEGWKIVKDPVIHGVGRTGYWLVPMGDGSEYGVTSVTVTVDAEAIMDRAGNKSKEAKKTVVVGPVIDIQPGGYAVVLRAEHEPPAGSSHLGDPLYVGSLGVRGQIIDPQPWDCMPDLTVFFGRKASPRPGIGGGAIVVKVSPKHDNKTNPITVGSVGISEIMWSSDEGLPHGGTPITGRSNLDQAREQWIELHNLNSFPVKVTLFAYPDEHAITMSLKDKANEIDRMSNYEVGNSWSVENKGQSGNSQYGADFIAMWRPTPPADRSKMYNHGDFDGKNKDKWKASTHIYLTRQSGLWSSGQLPLDNLNYDFVGTPGRSNTLTVSTPPLRTDVKHSPVIFNEIANRTNSNRYYEWIELRNVTDAEVNLREYRISYVTAKDTEIELYTFADNDDTKIPAKGVLLLVDTDPEGKEDHPIAADNPNMKYKVTDFKGDGLPDDGMFALILRKANGDKPADLKKPDHVIDVVGYDDNLVDASKYTSLWPLVVFGAPDARNKLVVETVHHRQHVIDPDKNTHNDDKDEHQALRDAGYTGIGYKRLIPAIPAHGGTPGYDNGVAKEYNDGDATVSAAPVTISEVMYHTDSGRLPQWIELYNSSMTEVVRVEDWTLQLENADDVSIGIPRVSVKLAAKLIQPNQTILIVASTTGNNSDHFPDSRVIDIWTNGLKDKDRLEIEAKTSRRGFKILSETSFRITLKDKAGKVVDTAGNFGAATAWDLPKQEADGDRSSLIRRYDDGTVRDGTMHVGSGWVLAASSELYQTHEMTYYGNITDIGSPGYRAGGPVPVSLSKFRPERLDDGSIVVRWITESELNNAGFNILRSETRSGEYTKLNTQLIAGQGTTSERTTYAFPDKTAKPNVVYYYQIQDVSLDGKVNTLRVNRLKGHISAADKLTTTWGELKALQ